MMMSFSGVERVSEEPDGLRLFCCTESIPNSHFLPVGDRLNLVFFKR